MYYFITTMNVIASLILGGTAFLFPQGKANSIRERALLVQAAKQIRPGDEFEMLIEGHGVDPDRSIKYTVVDVRPGGWVKYIHTDYPNATPNVEQGFDFLKHRTRVIREN
jgi:hypothetical protein